MFEWFKKEAPLKALAGMGGGVGRGAAGGGEATGGTIVYYNDKTLHMFKSSDTFSSNGSKTCEYVIVAGGAAGSSSGGGGTAGGGGGAGGYLFGTGLVLDGDFRVEVGDGGTCPGGGSGTPGTPSYIGPGPNWTGNSVDGSRGTHAIGGGRGGDYQPNTAAHHGGSGGGGDYNSIPAGYGFNPGTPSPLRSGEPRYWPGDTQGYPGGNGTNNPEQIGGAGGGASQAGAGGAGSGMKGGDGVRIPTTWRTPDINIGAPGPNGLWYCCGGGGGARFTPGSYGNGGYGGGGRGNSGGNGYDATANSGGGGGGIARADPLSGGSGGSGFVLIGYPT